MRNRFLGTEAASGLISLHWTIADRLEIRSAARGAAMVKSHVSNWKKQFFPWQLIHDKMCHFCNDLKNLIIWLESYCVLEKIYIIVFISLDIQKYFVFCVK